MKKIIALLVVVLFCKVSFGQDVIYKNDGSEIKSKVVEITSEVIKYKSFERQDGPIYNIYKSEVFMIIYEDGFKDVFKKETPAPKPQPQQTTQSAAKPVSQPIKQEPQDSYHRNHNYTYFSIASGYGNSYGGIGIRIQGRFGDDVGFGIHGGVGYFPDAPVMVAGGVKFFFYRGLYINTQFGIFGVGQTWEYSYDYYYGYSYGDYDQYLLYGPSLMTGGDWIFGKHFGFNAALGASLDLEGEDLYPALELGFIFKF